VPPVMDRNIRSDVLLKVPIETCEYGNSAGIYW
jgi:hypothetical protein